MTPRRSLLGLLLVIAACGGGEPPLVPGDDAQQVPPPEAGSVEIVGVSLTSGTDRSTLGIEGTKPTPCHEVGWFVEVDGSAVVTIWSELPAPEVVCAQVIKPFSIEVDLGPLEPGTEVVVNGEVVATSG
ncbi:MAG: hypothetical protein WEA76_10070 [Acidimicrobiia bacterium]